MEFLSLVLLMQKEGKSALIKAMWKLHNVINGRRFFKKRKRERANNVEIYEEAQKLDQRDQGTEIMAKRTIGEPKAKLEKGKEKQKANSGTESIMPKHS